MSLPDIEKAFSIRSAVLTMEVRTQFMKSVFELTKGSLGRVQVQDIAQKTGFTDNKIRKAYDRFRRQRLYSEKSSVASRNNQIFSAITETLGIPRTTILQQAQDNRISPYRLGKMYLHRSRFLSVPTTIEENEEARASLDEKDGPEILDNEVIVGDEEAGSSAPPILDDSLDSSFINEEED